MTAQTIFEIKKKALEGKILNYSGKFMQKVDGNKRIVIQSPQQIQKAVIVIARQMRTTIPTRGNLSYRMSVLTANVCR